MIKDLLMFILLFQSAYGQVVNYSSDYSPTTSPYSWEQMCTMYGGILVDHWQKICIPEDQRRWIQLNPATFDTDGKMKSLKTEVRISLSKIEIIEIADLTVSLNMDVRIDWYDYRLSLKSEGIEKIYLGEEEQKQIWSPQILIASNVKSESRKDKLLAFSENPYYSTPRIEAMKKFSLSTEIKCDMDFRNFPFDEHICYLEVS